MTPFEFFLQQFINGLTIGMIYALVALGYTMVYGIIQLINFAHGEIFMVGGYLGLTVILIFSAASSVSGGGFFLLLCLMFIFSMTGCGLMGIFIERVAYRPLRNSPRLTALISAIGVSFILQNVVMLVYGPQDKSFPPLVPSQKYFLGNATITLMQLIILTVSVAEMVFLNFFVKKTKLGKAMRATSQDIKMASLVGISPNKVITLAFLLGSVFASTAGILFGLYYNTINFHDGYLAGLKAFAAAVLGGIGNIPGAMLGGILIGLAEGFGAGYLSSEWKNVFAFLILILILIFKPTGLLGERISDRA